MFKRKTIAKVKFETMHDGRRVAVETKDGKTRVVTAKTYFKEGKKK